MIEINLQKYKKSILDEIEHYVNVMQEYWSDIEENGTIQLEPEKVIYLKDNILYIADDKDILEDLVDRLNNDYIANNFHNLTNKIIDKSSYVWENHHQLKYDRKKKINRLKEL